MRVNVGMQVLHMDTKIKTLRKLCFVTENKLFMFGKI